MTYDSKVDQDFVKELWHEVDVLPQSNIYTHDESKYNVRINFIDKTTKHELVDKDRVGWIIGNKHTLIWDKNEDGTATVKGSHLKTEQSNLKEARTNYNEKPI